MIPSPQPILELFRSLLLRGSLCPGIWLLALLPLLSLTGLLALLRLAGLALLPILGALTVLRLPLLPLLLAGAVGLLGWLSTPLLRLLSGLPLLPLLPLLALLLSGAVGLLCGLSAPLLALLRSRSVGVARSLCTLLPLLLSWDLTLRPPLLVLPGLLALCRLLSPLLRGTVRRALSLRLLALLRSRRNNTLTAEAHTLLLQLLQLLGRKRLPPLLARCLLLAWNGSISLLSPLLRCGLLLLLGRKRLPPLLRCCKRSTLRCLGLSPLLRCRLLLLLLGPLSPLLRGRLGCGGLGRLRRLVPLLLRALLRLRLSSSWCRSSRCRSSRRRGRGRCSRLLFYVGLCLHGFSCRLYGRRRLVRCLSFRLGNRRMTGR